MTRSNYGDAAKERQDRQKSSLDLACDEYLFVRAVRKSNNQGGARPDSIQHEAELYAQADDSKCIRCSKVVILMHIWLSTTAWRVA